MQSIAEQPIAENITDFELVRTDGKKHVIFFLDEEMFAVPAEYVAEVDRLLAVTPLPNVPHWLLGIANLRGDIVSVVDLRKFWERTSSPPQKTKTIILRDEDDETLIAFVIDRLGEIANLQISEAEFITETTYPMPHAGKKVRHQESCIYILDAASLLSSPKLQTL